ncbi:hypothetical protein JVT61DRAFT_14045 [Boletus reticuloceps]|uniref:Uncharacterized protein n=1 Tax=Boletus reticuloceps TaxID=495285 RepID=A0A8I3AAP3_9AGAM|nr:hypothetical protein JVT61DRAFT_14045 [Boletus reticuloceps]
MYFTPIINGSASTHDFSSFFAGARKSGISHTIQGFRLHQSTPFGNGREEAPILGLDNLRPCTASQQSASHTVDIDIKWNVGLIDSDLLTLVSTWPQLESLVINLDWGWNTPGGNTPNRLLQLLRKCRSLGRSAVAIDTRGYTELSQSPESLGLMLSRPFSIYIVDSRIEVESASRRRFHR